ncbi:MAG: hypothetical protein L3J67_04050 [Hyphomicrobiaceae bacterium]|nr:hypothetical protein [Hyphomicrobiaceae bacterium]
MLHIKKIMILSALATAALPSSPSWASDILSKQQIATEIIGKTLNAKRMGMSVKIFYKKDGTVKMHFPIFSGAGTWKYKGDGICMMLTSGPKKGKTCLTFEHLGGNKYRNSEGIEFTIPKE